MEEKPKHRMTEITEITEIPPWCATHLEGPGEELPGGALDPLCLGHPQGGGQEAGGGGGLGGKEENV